jgi:hydrogenase-4 component B
MNALPEWLALAGVALAAVSGVPGLFFGRTSRTGDQVAVALLSLGALAGITGAAIALGRGQGNGLSYGWSVPGGALAVRIDAISAMFLIQIFTVTTLSALYGLGYWRQADHPDNGRKLRAFYGALTAGMALLVIARNTMLFMLGWEVMALAAFFVLTTEDDRPEVRDVGYVYIVATHVGTLCLFALFALLKEANGSFDLVAPASAAFATAMFLLAIGGFGMKAGVMPMHVWLPGAHAAAPSHISAIMSGVLLKTGIYGLVRITSLFAHPPIWWGWLILGLGTVSAVLGVAFAVGQHDIKRLLAYHSVENIGIICMGLGIALLGRSLERSDLVALGLAGALLHTWNHSLFKALLFLSAGAVVHATGTREIDRLGGLSRRMPWTALAFILGAVAICGLPPLNGFVSELLVYLGLFRQVTSESSRLWLVGAFAAPALALVGTLAVACFVKVVGAVFLGEPRSDLPRGAHECPPVMRAPMFVLAALCVLIGAGAPLVAPILDRAIAAWAPESSGPSLSSVAPLGWVSISAFAVVALAVALGVLLRSRLRAQEAVGTWDCGYAQPSPTMQYTSSSFAEMLVGFFGFALRPEAHRPHLAAAFPGRQKFKSHVPEAVLDRLVVPSASAVGRGFYRLRWIQRGSVHRYLLYILITLLLLFVWK